VAQSDGYSLLLLANKIACWAPKTVGFPAHSEELHKTLAPYIADARKAGARRPARGRRNPRPIDTHQVREWAKEQGIQVKDRGRVPADIVEKYRQAIGQ
jgi:hypothetical protein